MLKHLDISEAGDFKINLKVLRTQFQQVAQLQFVENDDYVADQPVGRGLTQDTPP
jgi:hypothetical protein